MADTYAADRISREIEAAKALKASLGVDAEDAELLADMVEGETSLFELLTRVLDAIEREDELINGIAAREAQLKERKERIRYRQAGLKAKVEQAILIFGEKVELPEATLYLSKRGPKLLITDEAAIPSQFWKRGDPTLDKAGLLAHLKKLQPGDEPLPGCELEPSPDTLNIRKK
jgi:hypothetical protein